MKLPRGRCGADRCRTIGRDAWRHPRKSAAHVDYNGCQADNRMMQTTLYFGLSRPAGKDITAQEWQQFVDRDVTPRFRDGLTVFDARGQWLRQQWRSRPRIQQGANADS